LSKEGIRQEAKITIGCVVSLEPLKKGEAKEFCF